MITQQILAYINQQLQAGVSKETIMSILVARGWQQSDIYEAFFQATSGAATPVQPAPVVQSAPVVQALPVVQAAPPAEEASEKPVKTGKASKNGKATAGLALGLIGFMISFVPYVGAPASFVGLFFAIAGLKSQKHGRAIFGIVLSLIGLVSAVLFGVVNPN